MLWVRNPSAKVRVTCSAVYCTILPARRLACASPATSGSTPITFTEGLLDLTAVAMPLIIPPPPTGTSTVSTSGRSSRISNPIVPWPAMIFSSSYGGTMAYPHFAASSCALSIRSSLPGPTNTISAPSAAVASRFIAGALLGITITAFTPNALAAYATPCA